MRRHMLKKLSPANVFASALEAQEFVQQLPAGSTPSSTIWPSNKVQVKVDAFDEARLMDNLQKIANRIALGLVLAALIVGAALMMQVSTPLPPLRLPRARHAPLPARRGLRLRPDPHRLLQRRLAGLAEESLSI